MRRAAELTILFAVVIAATFLRFAHLGDVSFWLDELTHYDVATAVTHSPWWRWITGIEVENGALFYASELAGRFVASRELSARLAPALFGTTTIPLLWLAARKLSAHAATPAIAAILLAVSPLHVYYSREARPYALLLLVTTALLVATLARAHVAIVGALIVLVAYTTAVGATMLVGYAIATLLTRERRCAAYSAIALLTVAVMPLMFGRVASPSFPQHVDRTFFRGIAESFSVVALDTSVHHRTAFVVLALALVGAIELAIRNRRQAVIVIGMAFLPASIALTALWHFNHFYAVRYLASSLPAYLLLVAEGIAAIIALLRRGVAFEIVAGTAAALGIAFVALPAARSEPFRKVDWRGLAKTIWSHSGEGDWIVVTNAWPARCLGFYLRELPPRNRVVVGAPSDVVDRWQGTWIVSAGLPPTPRAAAWMCRYPLVYADALESLRVHYAPSLAHYLATHANAAERHALAHDAIRNDRFALAFGNDDDPFLTSGWGAAELAADDDFRWVVGTRAMLLLPFDTRADRRIAMRVMPSSAHRVDVALNDAPIASIELKPGWNDYAIDTRAAQWRSGAANLLTFTFDAAAPPSESDRRLLAASFTELRVNDGAPASRAYAVWLDASFNPTGFAEASECIDDATFVHVARSMILDARDRDGDLYWIDLLRRGVTRTKVISGLIDEKRRSTPHPLLGF